jgi:hypothetical protein
MLILADAARARPADRIRGADAEAAKTVLREMSNAASRNVLLFCHLQFSGLHFCRSCCVAWRRLARNRPSNILRQIILARTEGLVLTLHPAAKRGAIAFVHGLSEYYCRTIKSRAGRCATKFNCCFYARQRR